MDDRMDLFFAYLFIDLLPKDSNVKVQSVAFPVANDANRYSCSDRAVYTVCINLLKLLR